ncbi:MAG: hypothetical protein Q9227_008746 [Pyrenula ochraceoflavens]
MWQHFSKPSTAFQPIDNPPDPDTLNDETERLESANKHVPVEARSARDRTSSLQKEFVPTYPEKVLFRRSVLRDWWLEIGACVIAVASIAAIFATLYPYAGKTLPQWRYGLTINSLISIYIVILKAVTLYVIMQGIGQLKWTWFQRTRPLEDVEIYDEASRGTVKGAFWLLWRVRGIYLVPTVGSLVVILTLVSDPIAQQLVHYSQCRYTMANQNASIPRANSYVLDQSKTGRLGNMQNTIPPQLQAAINAGVFNPSALSIPFNCPSGNCTIPDTYSSIAYCSTCEDVTHEAKMNETRGSTLVTLPSGLQAEPGVASFVMGLDGEGANMTTIELISTTMAIGGPRCSDAGSWPCQNYSAARCSLYPCTRTYSASIKDGHLREKEVSQQSAFGRMTQNLYLSTLDMSCVTAEQKQSLHDQGYKFDDRTKWMPYNVSYTPNLSPDDGTGWASADDLKKETDPSLRVVPPKCIYQESLVADNSIAGYMSSFLSGNVSAGPGDQGGTNAVVEQVYKFGNITFDSVTQLFENISLSMTTEMRTNGEPGRSAPVLGTVTRYETCVKVKWEWITFPVALLVLTLVFFAGMVVQTRPKDETSAHDYKTSALALMFHGLEPQTVAKGVSVGRSGSAAALERQARGIFVRLGTSEKGWRFVESEPKGR